MMDFFTQMRELDSKREKVLADARADEKEAERRRRQEEKEYDERRRKEDRESQEKILQSQKEAIDEQRRFNERMYTMQMDHLAELKQMQSQSEPLTLLATALDKGIEKIGPAMQARMGGVAPTAGAQGGALPAPQQQGGQPNMNIINGIKQQPFFAEELREAAMKVKGDISPAFTVNKLMGLMQYDPSISIVLDYVVTRPIKEVVGGVNLDSESLSILQSEKGQAWWSLFQQLLSRTMNGLAQEAMGNTAAGGGEAAPGGGGAAGAGGGGGGFPDPTLNSGQV
jgi:hypothetical protein